VELFFSKGGAMAKNTGMKAFMCIVLILIPSMVRARARMAENCFSASCCPLTYKPQGSSIRERKLRFAGHSYITDFFGGIIEDIVDMHCNLVSGDSFSIIAGTMPFFIAARMIDEPLQSYFHHRFWHKNVHQLPGWCHDAARYVIGVPAVFFGLQGLFSHDYEKRVAGQLLAVGLPFVVFGKDILKNLRFRCGLRPWHENFSPKKRSGGGFPSGHVAEATFVAVLYGLRFGGAYAIPLTMGAAFVAGTFLNCNRHYLSQIVAGAGLGILYGVAASKVVDMRLDERSFVCGVTCDSCGRPQVRVSYKF
jgi:membrane-associated phospholipid phosphatase